jgi:hypothetical protein
MRLDAIAALDSIQRHPVDEDHTESTISAERLPDLFEAGAVVTRRSQVARCVLRVFEVHGNFIGETAT